MFRWWAKSLLVSLTAAALAQQTVIRVDVKLVHVTATVKNNASKGNAGGDFFVSASSSGSVEDYNVVGDNSSTATGAHDHKSTDPLWVAPASGDFTLQGASPCKLAGVTVASVTVDYAGTTRGVTPSVGAYE